MDLQRHLFSRVLTASVVGFLLLMSSPLRAETLVNWELGFEVDVPDYWLRVNMKESGLKLNSDVGRMQVEPYGGMTQQELVAELHQRTKEEGFEFKTERSYAINQVPAHEMIFYKGGKYRIYYVLMAGQRGFLWTVLSESTDSEAFLEGQDVLASFRVTPKQ